MTPPISKQLMASRPLYDPSPSTFVAEDLVKQKELRRVRLSDFAVVALHLNIKAGTVTKAAVDMFENVYVRGAKVRATRVHEGRPALAPDNTVISMNGAAYPGKSGQPAGEWNTENVKDCEGYDNWIAAITQSEKTMVERGFRPGRKNQPFPAQDLLTEANSCVLSPVKKEPAKKASASKPEKGALDCADPLEVAKGMVDEVAASIQSFLAFVQSAWKTGDAQDLTIRILEERVASELRRAKARASIGDDASSRSGSPVEEGTKKRSRSQESDGAELEAPAKRRRKGEKHPPASTAEKSIKIRLPKKHGESKKACKALEEGAPEEEEEGAGDVGREGSGGVESDGEDLLDRDFVG